jgi:predicted amidophosphoribosyltransferase
MGFTIVIVFMVLLGGVGLVAAFLPRPSRECPNCGKPVPLTAPRCRHCDYPFAPDGSPRYIR